MSVRYGYIGLGMMGSAMAENLIGTGAPVTVHDLVPAAVDRAVAQGATAGASAAEVAANSDVVSICVPAAEHLVAVLDGPGGIAEGAHDGLVVLVHSTVHPDSILEAQATAARWGVAVFDASVAGGDANARAGTQTMLVGGMAEMNDATRGLIEIYGETIIDAGPVGAGAALKLAVNVMTYAQFGAAATGYDLITGVGGDPESLWTALRGLGQLGALTDSYRHILGIPAAHITGDFATMLRTQVGIAEKDLTLARSLGETRARTGDMLDAIRDSMAALYGVEGGQP
jgi:3-hydroxyisobutyrate dehydrogenase-like beta-hydroxyacid dehydrogenase